jgi:hypothetical protein
MPLDSYWKILAYHYDIIWHKWHINGVMVKVLSNEMNFQMEGVYFWSLWKIVSASSPLVGFGRLNDNTIRGLTSILSVEEQTFDYIVYTWRYELVYDLKCIKGITKMQTSTLCWNKRQSCMLLWISSSQSRRNQRKWIWW